MKRNQVILLSLLAAVPAAFLTYVLAMSAVNHGGSVFAGLRWVLWGPSILFAAVTLVIPGLIFAWYPKEGFNAALAGAGPVDAGPVSIGDSEESVEDEEFAEAGDELDAAANEDDGEQLFDDGAVDEFEDDAEVNFGDDDEDSKY